MNKTSKFLRLSLLSLIFWGLSGCNYLINLGFASPPLIEISQIEEQKDKNEVIKVRGKVEKIVPLLNSNVYELKDKTGSIWIVTSNTLPRIGEQITIEGKTEYQKITIGNENLGQFYLTEIKKVNNNSQTVNPENNYLPVDLNKKPAKK